MKIVQLLSGLNTPLSNEETNFLKRYERVTITSLNERDNWVAQNLVRKGVYSIAKDNNTLIKKTS